MDKWGQLAWEARRQLGVVTVSQAEKVGIDRRTLARRAAQSGWKRLHRGVYLLPGIQPDYRTRVSAALLAIGPHAAAARRTAAALWGLVEGEPQPIEVVVPHDAAPATRTGLHIIRSRTLEPKDITTIGPLKVTHVERTLCDLAGVLGQEDIREAVARAGQRAMTWPRRAVIRAATLEHLDGRQNLLLAARDVLGEGRTDSVLERRLRRVLLGAGLHPAPGIYPIVERGKVLAMADIAFPEHKLIVEADGFAYHATPTQLRADHARQNRLEAAGWAVLRFSAGDLHRVSGHEHRPGSALVSVLVATLGARARAARSTAQSST